MLHRGSIYRVNGTASVLLLFVAAGLLVLAGVAIGRSRGRPVRRRDSVLMAAMVGIAVTFLFVFMPVVPLVIFPFVIAGILVATWIAERTWLQLGSFLVGGGSLLFTMEVLSRTNDLVDPAVTEPGWTPIPMALGAAFVIVGAALAGVDWARGATS